MCGLVGIFDARGARPVAPALLDRMRDTLAHRGPDGAGSFIAPGIGLGHRRLAIIDPSGGHQPMYNENGTVAVVFNGEIYNHHALTAELEGLGHVFKTRCDTEVIAHAWEQWGADCARRFAGMFALAVWDATRETLFLARDRLGKKPLYYAGLPDGTLLFGSELKALEAHPAFPRQVAPEAVADFMAYGYIPDPRTIYAGAAKLPPAHLLVWRRGEAPRVAPYWDVAFGDRRLRADEAAEELRGRLSDAVARRLESDVPLGAFLSGGVDSSAVVALMAERSTGPVRTFAIGFRDRAYDESAHAATIAGRFGTEHHVELVNPDATDLLDHLSALYDEPFGDPSAIPTWRVAKLARRRVTVALSGDGGDEVFAGYRRYPWHLREERVRALMPGAMRRPLFAALATAYPKLDWAPRWLRARATFRELSRDAADAWFAIVAVMEDVDREPLFTPAFRRALGGYHPAEPVRRAIAAAPTDDPFRMAQYADLKTWLAGDILVKVDRAAMAHGLEVRAPLLDHELIEWSANLDRRLIIDGGGGKPLLKSAVAPLLPPGFLDRPKQGFSIPLSQWFRGPLAGKARAVASSNALLGTGWFEPAALARLADQHVAGQRDHGRALWLLLMLDAFLRRAG